MQWIHTSLEIQLQEWKIKNPDKQIPKEKEQLLDTLKNTEMWIRRLQDDYNATNKSSWKDHTANLHLTHVLIERNNKIAQLEKELQILKENLETLL